MPAFAGARRALLSGGAPGWTVPAASLDIDFANRRLASNGRARSFAAFMAYNGGLATGFSRASVAYDQRAADPLAIDSYGIDVPRLRGDGLLIGPSTTRLSTFPQNPQAWSQLSTGGTKVDLSAEGSWRPARIISAGNASNRLGFNQAFSVTSGMPVSMRMRYRAGTSGRARIVIRSVSPVDGFQVLSGPSGGLVSIAAGLGAWSNIRNVVLGSGLYEIEATWTPNINATDVTIAIGPDSATTGEFIDIHGGFVSNSPYPREWILGAADAAQALAQDLAKFTAAQAGLRANEGFAFWRGIALGFDPAIGGRLLVLQQGGDVLSRVEIIVTTSGRASVLIYDDANAIRASMDSGATIIGSDVCVGLTWGGGTCRMRSGAATPVSTAAPSPTAVSTLSIGSRPDASGPAFACHRRIVAGARRLSDAEFDATFARIAA